MSDVMAKDIPCGGSDMKALVEPKEWLGICSVCGQSVEVTLGGFAPLHYAPVRQEQKDPE
jgi:hypothetical protein